MPRKRKTAAEGEVLSDVPQRSNGFDSAVALGFVKRVEDTRKRIDEIMVNARKACQPHRDDIKAIAKEAAENGITKKVFIIKLKERRLLAQADAQRGRLSEDQQDEFDLLSEALGDYADTPLGAAAMDHAHAASH